MISSRAASVFEAPGEPDNLEGSLVLRPYDVVIINGNVSDEEIRGRRGYIVGQVTDDQIGVFVYDHERVWCLHPSCVNASGERDDNARMNRGAPIRVNQKGDIVG